MTETSKKDMRSKLIHGYVNFSLNLLFICFYVFLMVKLDLLKPVNSLGCMPYMGVIVIIFLAVNLIWAIIQLTLNLQKYRCIQPFSVINTVVMILGLLSVFGAYKQNFDLCPHNSWLSYF